MTARNYSQATLKLLFAASGNLCAYPGCSNSIVALATEESDPAVLGQICHIYAAADNGPRGKPGLTERERNSVDNLILMCGHHHPLVDKQYEDYPAEKLKAWKRTHEATFQQSAVEALRRRDAIAQSAYVQRATDTEIAAELDRIRKGRHFSGFPINETVAAFARRVDSAELSGGSDAVRAAALAWCARLFAKKESVEQAKGWLEKSRALGVCEDAVLADAFIESLYDKPAALAKLAPVSSKAARTAALRIMSNADGSENTLDWVAQCGLALDNFDADGKFVLIMHALQLGRWDDARRYADLILDEDFYESPPLHFAVAMAYLVQAVPEEFRATVLQQVPFQASTFPLASDAISLSARRRAQELFALTASRAMDFGASAAANLAADYDLWLSLSDPDRRAEAITTLREDMRNPGVALRRIFLALQFGVTLDLASIEKELDRRLALSGKGTPDDAIARLSLALTRPTPQEVADYIAKHRDHLHAYLTKSSVYAIEIEALAQADQLGLAQLRLDEAIADGMPQREVQLLQHLIDNHESSDPAAAAKQLFEATSDLRDLFNLTTFLERRHSWVEMLPYAERLFGRTHALEDAKRVALALNVTGRMSDLHAFLSRNLELVPLSNTLRTLWVWSLFRAGRLREAAVVLDQLSALHETEQHRTLRIQLAIVSGQWDSLVAFTEQAWRNRDLRNAKELLAAGRLAQAVGSPLAKDLVIAAADKAPDDAQILASAFFHSTEAGWERNSITSGWLRRASELSTDSGPLRRASLRELLDQKPAWEEHVVGVLEQLTKGTVPVFGAAHVLRRSLTDFTLTRSIGNARESDPRRRLPVFAFSGARTGGVAPSVRSIGVDISALLTLTRLNLLDTMLASYANIAMPHSTLSWLFEERQKVAFHQPSRIRDAHELLRLVANKSLSVQAQLPVSGYALAREIGEELAESILSATAKNHSSETPTHFVIRSSPVPRIGSLMEEEADLSAFFACLCSCQAIVRTLKARGFLTIEEETRANDYLTLHERPWPSDPSPPVGSVLYLDGLSVTYLQTVGVLVKLREAGYTIYIHQRIESEALALMEIETLAVDQIEYLEKLRCALASGLATGKIRLMPAFDNESFDGVRQHPTFDLLAGAADVDAIVIDDRFVNRHKVMDTKDRQVFVFSSLDLIDDLSRRGILTEQSRIEHRTSLRRAGYQFVPVELDELKHHLSNAPVIAGAMAETAELRAIRESLLQARMSGILQIPGEVPWLHESMKAAIEALKSVWQTRPDLAMTEAISDWLLLLIDIRGWAHAAIPGNERSFALFAHAAQILSIMSPPDGISTSVREAFDEWLQKSLLDSIRSTEPEIHHWLLARAEELVAQSVNSALAAVEE
ncbi:MAG: hypothetical protein ACLPSW_02920 [Roseiarcus sp.]